MKPIFQLEKLDDRISILRTRCLERKSLTLPWDGEPRVMVQSLQASEGIASWTLRRGILTRDLLAGFEFAVDDLELILGRPVQDCPEWKAQREATRTYLADHYPNLYTPGQSGHAQLDLSRLFELGIDGLKTHLELRREGSTGRKAETYQSFIDALAGLSQMSENAALAAERAEEQTHPNRCFELKEMAAICRHIAHKPPVTFRQALQLMWLVILGVQFADRACLVVPGHIDRVLGRYYQQDTEAGRLTVENALLLIESLYLLINEYVPDGLAVSVMVGGRDASGNDQTNPLSYLCLEALRRTRLVYPTVGICWHDQTPDDLTGLAVELISKGSPNPAFFGDQTIQRGLQSYGVPSSESCNYINSTCVEITPVGSSNVWVASPYYSTNKILLDEIEEQVRNENVADDFDEFFTRYKTRLAGQIAQAVAVENGHRRIRQQFGGKPLQSIFTRDCIERGRDIDKGGARYNWAECSFVGLANLADGLTVINEEVFIQKRLSLKKMLEILAANFKGYELEHLRFMNAYPKYGNNHLPIDSLVGKIVEFVRDECANYPLEPDDSPYVPGAFCWVMHEILGRECGATPDGRLAGFPFADGCGPAQGRESRGPTAAVLSTTSWDAAPLIGGAAFNMKFSSTLFSTPSSTQRLHDLIVTFLQRGGFETQVNVVDAKVLHEAQVHPEEHRDLVVRIGGYTDYFTRLSPEMQAEVILRTEYTQV